MRWNQIATAWARLPFEAAFLRSSRSDVDSERGGGAVRAASFTSDLHEETRTTAYNPDSQTERADWSQHLSC
jgi:hypothetical protein